MNSHLPPQLPASGEAVWKPGHPCSHQQSYRHLHQTQVSGKRGPQLQGLLPMLGTAQAYVTGLWSQAKLGSSASLLLTSWAHLECLWASLSSFAIAKQHEFCPKLPGVRRPCPQRALRAQLLQKGLREICVCTSIGCMSKRGLSSHSSWLCSRSLCTTMIPTHGQGHSEQTCQGPPSPWVPSQLPLPVTTPSPMTESAGEVHGPVALL